MDQSIRRHIDAYIRDRWYEAWAYLLVYGSIAAIAITIGCIAIVLFVQTFRFFSSH
ncbi:MAG: hypothetical protein QM757_26485 [Paludibaculum sp.]